MLTVVLELLHTYEVPPPAEREALSPLQIEMEEGVAEAAGLEFTVTVLEVVAEQPVAPYTVTL